MKARRIARWAVRAVVVGALAFGAIYGANYASADEAPPAPPKVTEEELSVDGPIWT
jgi:hypothetical protein